jgi:hypothetical protein
VTFFTSSSARGLQKTKWLINRKTDQFDPMFGHKKAIEIDGFFLDQILMLAVIA